MPDNPLLQLRQNGQSVWLDDLNRRMLRDGSLERLIREDGVSGVTSNPKIFQQAISSGTDYDEQIRQLVDRQLPVHRIFEELAVCDVRDACDLLREVHDRTAGEDGFVSLEVSPRLARDTAGTIDEALRLWETVDRPNLFVKIPGTVEGLPAIRACLERGVNINVTLLFSLDRYDEVLGAWCAAVASAKLAYELWQDGFRDTNPAWARMREAGAIPMKLLWASTSTSNTPQSKSLPIWGSTCLRSPTTWRRRASTSSWSPTTS